MRVFLDANVLISASMPKSQMRILVLTLKERAQLFTNLYAIEEARRNVRIKKPEILSSLEVLCAECEIAGDMVRPAIGLAEKDMPILGGAIACKATHLLTGDRKDFGTLWGKAIHGVEIISPQMLADELVKKDWLKK